MSKRNEVLRVLTMVFAILGIIENLLLVPANFLCAGRAYAAEAQVQQTEEDKEMGDYENANFGNSVSREVPNPEGVIQNDAGEVQYIIQTEDKDTYRDVKAFVKEETGEKASPSPEQAKENQLCATLDQQAKEELENMDGVQIEEDFVLNGAQDSEDSQETQVLDEAIQSVVDDHWNIKAIHAEDAHGGSGQIKVAVLDSGADATVDYDVKAFVNLVDPERDSNGLEMDCSGHGTGVCSIIAQDSDGGKPCGIAGGEDVVELYSVKVLDSYNQSPVSRVVEGSQWCRDHDIDIINMRFGTDSYSACLEDAVQKAADAGILMVASVGNGGENSKVEYPAAFSEVVGVGSVDEYMNPSVYNAQGKELELLAPGENVPVNSFWGFYTVSGGTSFAAPHVSAVAALLWSQHPEWNSNTIRKVLQESARSISSDRETGYGLLDYAYAEKIAKDVKVSETATGAAVSGENRTKLKEYEIPAIVEANWKKDDHGDLIQSFEGAEWMTYSNEELMILINSVKVADDGKPITVGQVTLEPHQCDPIHANRHDGGKDGDSYTNYVAAAKIMYECAWTLYHNPNAELSALKAICDTYRGGLETDGQNERDRHRLRWMVQYATEKTFASNKGISISESRRKQLQLLGFALHAVGDAYAHQGIIHKDHYDRVCEVAQNKGYTIDDKEGLKSRIISESCTTKEACQYLKKGSQNGHSAICDNTSFEKARFNKGSKWGVLTILAYFIQPDPYLFDPYAFASDLGLQGKEYPYKIYNLVGNCRACGYDLQNFPRISLGRWSALSGINYHK